MKVICPLVIALFLTMTGSSQTQTDTTLPPASWYGVAWVRADDSLHWFNAEGVQASRPRPPLPEEAPGVVPQLALSPGGRTLVQAAQRIDGLEGLGFFDLQTGAYLQTHIAQPDERILLPEMAGMRDDRIAIGLYAPGATRWRIIVFDLTSGAAIHQLQSADPIAVVVPPGEQPQIIYYGADEVSGQPVIHFTLTAASGAEINGPPVFAWYPEEGTLGPSPYASGLNGPLPPGQTQYGSGERVFTFTNRTYPIPELPDSLPGGNAVGAGSAANPTTIYADGETYKTQPRWVAGGDWVAYNTQDARGIAGWFVVPSAAAELVTQLTLSADVQVVHGTPDGFLAVRTDNTITHRVDFNQPEGEIVFSGTAAPVVVHVTPAGVSFALDAVALPGTDEGETAGAAPSADDAGIIPACEGAPQPRLRAGQPARVIGSIPLRVRSAPAGQYLGEIPVGTEVSIVGGPECANGFLWWPVRWGQADGRALEGWSAEGDATAYYLEPLVVPTTATPPPPSTATPPVLSTVPFAPPTVTPSASGT
ncbi:MAG: hypothetical protein ACOCX3_00545 [Chloroflexota bacterium]